MKVYAERVATCHVTFYVYKLHGTFINHSYPEWCRRRADIFCDSNRNVFGGRLERREMLGRTVDEDASSERAFSWSYVIMRISNSKYPTHRKKHDRVDSIWPQTRITILKKPITVFQSVCRAVQSIAKMKLHKIWSPTKCSVSNLSLFYLFFFTPTFFCYKISYFAYLNKVRLCCQLLHTYFQWWSLS